MKEIKRFLRGVLRRKENRKEIVRTREYTWKEKVLMDAIKIRKDEIDLIEYVDQERFQKFFGKIVPHHTRDIHNIYNFKESYFYVYIATRPDRGDNPAHGYFFKKLPVEWVDINTDKITRWDLEFRRHYEDMEKRPHLGKDLFIFTVEELLQSYARYIQNAHKNEAIIVVVEGIKDKYGRWDKVYYTDWYLKDR